MRLDAFMRATGIITRRTLGKRACDEGLIEVNGRPARPSAEVRVGDTITARVGMKVEVYEVLQLAQRPVPRQARGDYVKLVSSEKVELDLP
jgi:ribosomal 50S subunit-recycling heat shock protein